MQGRSVPRTETYASPPGKSLHIPLGSVGQMSSMPSTDDMVEDDHNVEYVYRVEEEGRLDQELDVTTDQIRIQLFVYHICAADSLSPFPQLQMMMAPLPAPVDVGTVGAALAPKPLDG
jgi:hypothetical protein